MTASSIEASPQRYARAAGVLYLLVIVLGGFSEGYLINRLVVPGDAAATAHNIVASQGLWRLGVAGDLLVPLLAVVQIWVVYFLLRPVSRSLVLLDVFLGLVSLAVEAVSKLFLLLVLPLLVNPAYGDALGERPLQLLVSGSLLAHEISFNITLVFFGCACLVEGYLIYRSTYLPRFIGVLMQLAGVSYLVSCTAALFAPSLAERLLPASLLPALLGESSYCLWLLIKGVDVTKWNARLRALAPS
jgi:Domain of unknown function (DUF4386)